LPDFKIKVKIKNDERKIIHATNSDNFKSLSPNEKHTTIVHRFTAKTIASDCMAFK